MPFLDNYHLDLIF